MRNPASPTTCRIVTSVAAMVLVCTALSKLYTLNSGYRMLDLPDPLFLFRNNYLLGCLAALELFCALIMLIAREPRAKGLLLLWLGGNFILYHSAILISGVVEPCPCLGTVAARLGLSSGASSVLTKAIIAYFAFSGIYLIFWADRPSKRTIHVVSGPISEIDTEGNMA
jgi:hypothetical protein